MLELKVQESYVCIVSEVLIQRRHQPLLYVFLGVDNKDNDTVLAVLLPLDKRWPDILWGNNSYFQSRRGGFSTKVLNPFLVFFTTFICWCRFRCFLLMSCNSIVNARFEFDPFSFCTWRYSWARESRLCLRRLMRGKIYHSSFRDDCFPWSGENCWTDTID